MNAIERIRDALRDTVPGVAASLRRPRLTTGMWWLDTSLDGHDVTIQWSPSKGFGISATKPEEHGFGEGPEEVYMEEPALLARALILLLKKEYTVPPSRR